MRTTPSPSSAHCAPVPCPLRQLASPRAVPTAVDVFPAATQTKRRKVFSMGEIGEELAAHHHALERKVLRRRRRDPVQISPPPKTPRLFPATTWTTAGDTGPSAKKEMDKSFSPCVRSGRDWRRWRCWRGNPALASFPRKLEWGARSAPGCTVGSVSGRTRTRCPSSVSARKLASAGFQDCGPPSVLAATGRIVSGGFRGWGRA